MTKKRIGVGLVVVLIFIMVWSSMSEPGINDLDTQFKEEFFVRNENNTGPVQRRYLVTVSDTIWNDLERFGNLMPYTKLGSTEVFFFRAGSNHPTKLNLKGEPFPKKYESALLAVYLKNTMGKVSLKKY